MMVDAACPKVVDRCSLVGFLNADPECSMFVAKDGTVGQVIALQGKDYTGQPSEIVEGLRAGRRSAFERLGNKVTVAVQSRRFRQVAGMADRHHSIRTAGAVARAWAQHFTTAYRTRHYLIISSATGDLIDQLGGGKKSKEGASVGSNRVVVQEATEAILRDLSEYRPHTLSRAETVGFWGAALAGGATPPVEVDAQYWDETLATADLRWPSGKNYQVYRGVRDVYSGWVTIKEPGDGFSPKMIDALLDARREFTIHATFQLLTKEQAFSAIGDRERNTAGFARYKELRATELNELGERIEAGEIALLRGTWCVEVFGHSPEDVSEGCSELVQTIQEYRCTAARETANQEASFWSQFPGMHGLQPRMRGVTSENASDLLTFSSVGEGLTRCSWGDDPVTYFPTPGGAQFGFTFHGAEHKYALGHTLVIGGSESGKTTLMTFLMSQATAFPGWRGVIFDRLHGTEVFTRTHEGDYTDFVDRISVNPFQLPDSQENRAFLAQWVQVLTQASGVDNEDLFSNAVRQMYSLDPSERTLANFAPALGNPAPGSARLALNKWEPGGAYGHFFTSDRDALSFESQLVGFDMTAIIDLPELLGPMAMYLFHRILLEGRSREGGYMVFVDEAPKYLQAPGFAKFIQAGLQEIRKSDGLLALAAQSARSFLDSPMKHVFMDNAAAMLIFPNPSAEREDYVDGLGLEVAEWEWVKRAKGRLVMLKRPGGESAVLNVDLSALGKYLGVFNSSKEAIARVNQLAGSGDDWVQRFLG